MNDRAYNPFMYGLGVAVTVVWLASMTAEIVTSGAYTTPLAVHGLMGTVVGSVFADVGLRRSRKMEGEDDERRRGSG